jgi:hypothetical protein
MTGLTKDRFEVASKAVAIIGALISAVHGKVVMPYMEQLHHDDALEFMNHFQTSAEPQSGNQ